MPTLVRLLTTLALLALLVYGIMAALVYFVEPRRTEVTVQVPLDLAPEREGGGEPVPGAQ